MTPPLSPDPIRNFLLAAEHFAGFAVPIILGLAIAIAAVREFGMRRNQL